MGEPRGPRLLAEPAAAVSSAAVTSAACSSTLSASAGASTNAAWIEARVRLFIRGELRIYIALAVTSGLLW